MNDKNTGKPLMQNLTDADLEIVSGYIDGELTQQEAQKVAILIETRADYQQLHDELMTMRHEVQSLSLQEQELEHLDKFFNEPVIKTTRIFGMALIAISSILFIGFTLVTILTNPEIPTFEKLLVVTLSGGCLLLLISVVRHRLISAKNDKYKRVKI